MASFSSRKKEVNEVKLDENGNIDVESLGKELRNALEFDVRYKQTDNMKKKAIRQAGSYDEFKAMVACAHLKTLNRSEVESLRDVKRGWQKSHLTDKSHSAQILEQEALKRAMEETGDKLTVPLVAGVSSKDAGGGPKFRKPKTVMEFERDWRRLRKHEDRITYLHDVGTKRFKSLHQCEGDATILEEILQAVTQYATSSDVISSSMHPDTNPSTEETEAPKDKDNDKVEWTCKWLKAISGLDKFALLVRFIPRALIEDIVKLLPSVQSVSGEGTKTDVDNAVVDSVSDGQEGVHKVDNKVPEQANLDWVERWTSQLK